MLKFIAGLVELKQLKNRLGVRDSAEEAAAKISAGLEPNIFSTRDAVVQAGEVSV